MRAAVGFGLLIGLENGASFSSQSRSLVGQNQIKRGITFDAQLKTVPLSNLILNCKKGYSSVKFNNGNNKLFWTI